MIPSPPTHLSGKKGHALLFLPSYFAGDADAPKPPQHALLTLHAQRDGFSVFRCERRVAARTAARSLTCISEGVGCTVDKGDSLVDVALVGFSHATRRPRVATVSREGCISLVELGTNPSGIVDVSLQQQISTAIPSPSGYGACEDTFFVPCASVEEETGDGSYASTSWIAVASAYQRRIDVVDLESGACVHALSTHGRIHASHWASVRPSGTGVVRTAENHELCIYDLRSTAGCVQRVMLSNERVNDIAAIYDHPAQEGNYLVYGGDARSVCVMDVRTYKLVHSIPNITKFGVSYIHVAHPSSSPHKEAVILVSSLPTQLMSLTWSQLTRSTASGVRRKLGGEKQPACLQGTATWIGNLSVDVCSGTVACVTRSGEINEAVYG